MSLNNRGRLEKRLIIGWLIFCNVLLLAGLIYDLVTNP